MKFKREIIAIVLIICMLFTISAISAADSTTDVVSVTNDSVEAVSEDVANDNLAMKNDVEILKDGEVGTFNELSENLTSSSISAYDTVYLNKDYVYSDTDTITSGITISKHMTIDGQGHKIDAKGKTKIFTLTSGYNIIFKNITFCNGYGKWGGAISCSNKAANGPASVEIINCTFENNTASGYSSSSSYSYYGHGGAVYLTAKDHIYIINSTFVDNKANPNYSKNGGAAYINSNSAPNGLQIINSTFIRNSAKNYGGALYIQGKTGVEQLVDGCSFINNSGTQGSVIYGYMYGNFIVNNSVILNNGQNGIYIGPTTYSLNNNWWGNVEDDFNQNIAKIGQSGRTINDWLFLKFETDDSTGIATISLNNLYSSKTGDSSVYTGDIPQIKFKIKTTNVDVDKNEVQLNSEGKATFDYRLIGSSGSITVSYENIDITKYIKDLSLSGLKKTIELSEGSIIALTEDYAYNPSKDADLIYGVDFAKSITIDGQGHTLNAKELKRIFYINDPTKDVVLKNINFVNGNADVGGAINANVNSLTLINCTFTNNTANTYGGAIALNANTGEITENTFSNNAGSSVIYCSGNGNYNIHDSIINAQNIAVDGDNSATINANYNWWGNTADNYATSIVNVGSSVTRDNWVFLNMTTNDKKGLAEISLNNLYTIGVGNSTYSGYALPEITLNISSSNAKINKDNVKIDKTGKSSVSYVVKTTGSVTVSYKDEIALTKVVTYDDDGNFKSLKNLFTNIAEEGDTIELKWDYAFDSTIDSQLVGQMLIAKTLIIDGKCHTIDAKGQTNLVVKDVKVTFKNIIFVHGYSTYGGAVYYNSNLGGEFINCTFINNLASSNGGAICNYPGSVIIVDSTFINNTASDKGSAIYAYNNVEVSNSIFVGNKGGNVIDASSSSNVIANNNWWGHTIDNYETSLSIGSTVTANNWYVLDMSVDISTVSKLTLNNLYDGNGITIDNNCALPAITFNTKSTNTQLTKNKVTLDDGECNIEHTFSKKYSITASYNGVELTKSFVNIASFTELKTQINDATDELVLDQNYAFNPNVDNPNDIIFSKSLTIDGARFTIDAKGLSNIFYFNDDSNTKTLILKNIIFANATGENGAAVYFNGNRIEIINCTFINNTANGQGSAIYVNGANNNVENRIVQSTFINNTCANSIIYLNSALSDASFVVSDSVIVNNEGVTIAKGTGSVNADYNWWGNNASNYGLNIANVGEGINIEKWFYLNMTVDDEIKRGEISLNNLNDGSDYSYTLPELIFDISAVNAIPNKDNIILDSEGKSTVEYSLTGLTGSLTASYNSVRITNKIKFFDKGDFESLQTILNLVPEGYMYKLTRNYSYSENDTISTGILVDKCIGIYGNGFTVDAKGNSRIFNLVADGILLKNTNFKNGKSDLGGAIYFKMEYVTIDNCSFVNNSASSNGGAIYCGANYGNGNKISNSVFINNSVGSTGYTGSAIYNYGYYGTVDKCIFINNTGNHVVFQYSKEYISNSIFLDNSPSSIYNSYGKFNNNWIGNTLDNFDAALVSGHADKWLYLKIKFYEDYAVISLNNLYDTNAASSSVISDYNLPEVTLNINSTTLSLNINKFTLDSTGQVRVPYELIGETGALTVSYGDISLTKERVLGEFDSLQTLIDNADENSVIEFNRDYTYNDDDEITKGILINKNITIDGKGHTIDAKEMTRIFNVQALNVTFKNIIFANGKGNLGYDDGGNPGGAIYYNLDNTDAIEFNVDNCTFVNNTAYKDNFEQKYQGGAIYIKANEGTYNIKNCAFINNNALGDNGGAIYLNIKDSKFDLYNSSFIGNKAYYNGALYIETDNTETTIDKCLFRENTITSASYSSIGAAIIWKTANDNGNNVVKNSIFIDNDGNSAKNNNFAFLLKSGTVNIDDNWWGSTSVNYDKLGETQYDYFGGTITPNNWLFIDAVVSSYELSYNETSTIRYYLKSFDGNEIIEFDNSHLPNIDLNVDCDKIGLNKNCVSPNEEFTYTAIDCGNAYIVIYCNGVSNELPITIYGPYMVPIVDVPYIMYAGHYLNKDKLIKTDSGNYNGITVSCNSSLIDPNTDVGIRAGSNEGTAKLIFTYDGSVTNYGTPETYELVVKVFKVPLTINVTNLESREITLNVTDTLDLDIEAIVDKIHNGYAPAGAYVIDYKFDSSVISFTHDYYNKTDDPSYYATGHITAKGGGTTNLTICLARLNTDKFKCENYTIKITVNKAPTAVDFDDKDSFKVDDEGNVNAIFYNNGTQATTALIYESSNENVFKFINNDGNYNAMGNGTAVITVRFAGNTTHEASSKTLTVTVTKYGTTTAVTSNKDLSLRIDEKSQIVANVDPNAGALEYISCNESVATVSSTGLITAHRNGTATITVRYPGDRKYELSEDTISLTVSKNATEITAEDKTLKSTDENIDIGATLNITDAYTLEYSSDNESVVTVSSDGKLTAVGGGEAHITITYAESEKYLSSTKTITVTVNKLASEIIADTSISTNYLKQITINPTVKADGKEVNIGTISYFIGDESISNPFTVDRVGKFNITVKYAENNKFQASELNISVTSDKADNIIKVAVDDATYPDSITIKVNATVAGTYTIDINGTAYDVVANDTAGRSVKLAAGSYYANITGYASDYYYGITTNDTFTISKASNDVTVSVTDKYLPGDVTVSVSASVAGTYHVVINGTYSVDVVVGANGVGQNTILLPAGVKYQANTTFADHQNYTVSITNATFDVNRSNINLEIIINEIVYGSNVNGTINTNLSGTYTVRIANLVEFNVELNTGSNTFSHEVPLPVATGYQAEVSIAQSDDYNAQTAQTTFEVVQTATDFNASSTKQTYKYKEEIILKIELPDDVTGNVTFNYTDGTFIGEISDVTQSNEFAMPVVKVGSYSIQARFNGDGNYRARTQTVNFNVIPAVNQITVAVDEVTYPNVATVKVTADVEGTYKVNINGTDYDVVANGEGKLIKLAAGSYYANVTYSNENYTADTHNATFTVNKGNNIIVINVEDISSPGEVTVKVTATLAGTYTIDINGTKVNVAVGNEGLGSNKTTLAAGIDYVATAEAVSDENYTVIVNECTFTINKMNPNISAGDLVVDVEGTNKTNVQKPDKFDGKFTFKSGNESIATVDDDGVVTGVSGGTVTITITSHDAQNYTDDSVEITVTVNKIDSNIGVEADSFDVNVKANKSIVITGEFVGKVSYTSNDTSVATVDENGIVTGVSSGKAKITVNATDSVYYNDAVKYVEVTVKRIPSDIGVEVDSFDVDAKSNNSIVITGEFDGKVSYISNDTSVATVDENGVVTGIIGGKARITVNANESGKYEDAVVYVTVTVNKIAPNLNASDIIVEIDKSQAITVQPSDFGGKITFISSNDTIASVDSNGNVKGIKAGNVTITISAKNSPKYLDDSIIINVTVNKIKANGLDVKDTIEMDVDGSDDIIANDEFGRQPVYSSCNESIAKVDADGHITPVSGGIVNITVSVDEDEIHLAESKNITLTIKKIPATIEVDESVDVDVKENKIINIYGSYDGTVIFESTDSSIATVDSDGKVTGIKAGNVTVTVKFLNSPTYLDETHEVNVTVKKISAQLNVKPDSIEMIGGEKTQLAISTEVDYDGEITFTTSNSSIATVDKNGLIKAIDDGKVTITVNASESEKYIGDVKEITLRVGKLTYEITLDIGDVTAGENATAIITATDDGKLNVTVTKDSKIIKTEIVDANKYNRYAISDLGVGTYKITAKYDGNERYNDFEITKVFTVNPIYNYEFDVKVADTVLGQKANATIALPAGATGKIRIGEQEYDIKSIIELPVQNIAGKNNITAAYLPDESSPYASSEITAYYNVAKKQYDVEIIIPTDIKAGDDAIIAIDAYDGAVMTVYVDGEKQDVKDSKFTITAAAGTHNVIVNVVESDEYVQLTANATFKVTKRAAALTVNASNTKVGEKVTVDINITGPKTGIVIVNVNGSDYTVNISSAKSVEVTLDKAGKYDVSAKYLGDEIFEEAQSDKIVIEVTEKESSGIAVEIPENIKVGQTVVINVTSANDQIEVLINGVAQKINNSKVEFEVTKAGAYTIIVNTNETADYRPDSYIDSFNADKNTASIDISKGNIVIGEDIEVTVKSYDGAQIAVYVDGVAQTLTDNKFKVKATAGTHTITASVEETDEYLNAAANDTFTVDKLDCKITINASDVKVGEKAVIDINITDSASGIVSVNVNGTEYLINLENAKSVEVTFDKAGKYDVSAKYLGDDIYNGADSNKIAVKATEKASSNLIVEIPDGIKVGQTVVINVTSPNNQIEVLINGTAQKVSNGKVEFEVVSAGSYPIVVNAFETPDYKSDSYINAFSAGKNTAAVDINVGDIEIGYDIEVTVKSYGGADINVYVDGIRQTVIYGKFFIRATAGNHTIVANVAENDKYLSASANRTFKVDKKAPTITIKANDVRVGEKTTVDINSPDFITGIVIVNVNGSEYTVDMNSAKSIDVKLDNVGNYSISAKYLGDELFTEADSNAISVKATEKDPSNIDVVIPDNIKVGQTVIVNVVSDNDNITVLIDGNPQTVIDGKVEFKADDAGIYPVVVVAGETADYAQETYIGSLAVEKYDASVEIILPKDIEIGKDIEVAVKSYDGAVIAVNVDGKAQSVKDNVFTMKATQGLHTIIAGVAETDKYLGTTANATFAVDKLASTLTVNATDAKVGEKSTVTVNVTAKATGIVIVTVGDKEYSIDLENATSVDVVMDKAGKFNVSARYLGDDMFNASKSAVRTIEVAEKETPVVNVTVPEIKAGENGNITLNIPNATGSVFVIVDGVAKEVELDENGSLSYPLEDLKAGNHTVTVIYTGDENNEMAIESQSFSIDKKTSDVNVTVGDIKLGEDSEIAVSIPNATGNVSLIIDGVETSVALDENGNVNFTVPSLAADSHSIVVVYPGDDTHAPAVISKQINATAHESELKDIVVSGDGKITAVLVDDAGAPIANANITYAINGKQFKTATDASGVIVINASANSVVDIKYDGSDVILPSNTTIELKDLAPVRLATSIIASEYTTYAVDFDAGERGHYFKVRLVDENGKPLSDKPVKIGFNGHVYNKTTNSTGWAQLQINLKQAGRYTFAIAFLGDSEYNSSFTVQNINVKLKKTSIKAAAKSFKAGARTKSYTVNLKTDMGSSFDGNAYLKAGKTVTMKLNGRTYFAKTDGSGKATFALSISKRGKFVVALSFAGDKMYASSSTKAKITIR
ncbi:Ig-like domain repeat protein [uncultured Methanobrevibacter sp.]|uniref:Ig-like domain repeat protein n=1 Tax=uncultured Methanobrevibacter sp. TaxID=253161 RepID=UPI002628B7FF|nr:Ig-like domain repeat protein [uncultured Methanobrevibacter sp.]